ncbi:glycosyltransferase family 2 protein [Lacibacter sp. H407]|uniref:glycosyltransferase family 2 protein n=1 Tax=Lacibacter sp. H407 TaxID=3133423 RepID=UPI0030C3DA71
MTACNVSLISVIVPCYNAEAFLQQAIQSVLQQTHRNFELILVNDGSTDETATIIHRFNDSRIRYYYQENKGQCAASNFGLSVANGDYIKFFDADDLMNPMHLEAQVKRMEGRTDALASCAWGRFYDGKPASAIFTPEPVWKDLPSLDWIKISMAQKYDMMGAWLWLIPRSVITKTGGWDERLSLNNDFEFSMRLLTHVNEVLFASDALLYYRSGLPSLSQRPSVPAFKAAVLSTDLGCGYLLAKENSRVTQQLCADRYKEWLFRIYPADAELEQLVAEKVSTLGGSKRKMDGGLVFQSISFLFGWKRAKLLKGYLRRAGYRKLPFN